MNTLPCVSIRTVQRGAERCRARWFFHYIIYNALPLSQKLYVERNGAILSIIIAKSGVAPVGGVLRNLCIRRHYFLQYGFFYDDIFARMRLNIGCQLVIGLSKLRDLPIQQMGDQFDRLKRTAQPQPRKRPGPARKEPR